MSYATTNPPKRIGGGIGSGEEMWIYSSTDVHTDVDATDYFSNGDALGMKVNDIVIVVKTTATVGATLHSVGAVTAGGAATITPAILA
jgi:lipid-binding SYLF domain-containing protein